MAEEGIGFYRNNICNHVCDNVVPHFQLTQNEPFA
jgi:hypothetical protein